MIVLKLAERLKEKYGDQLDLTEYQAVPLGGYIKVSDKNGHEAQIYYGEMDEQGLIFKDTLAYQYDMDTVSYIGESLLEENTIEITNYLQECFKEEIEPGKLVAGLMGLSSGYTHRDFLKMSNYQEEVAAMIFEGVNWQSPETYLDEMERENELAYLDNGIILMTEGMELNDYLYLLYQEDWCQQRGCNIEELDEEFGINGECYVCLEEFIDNELKANRTYYIDLALRHQEYHVNHRAKIEDYCHAPVTVKEMCDYGYRWQGMIPLKTEDAKALYSRYEVYKLYEDDTEAAVNSFEDIKEHDGLFGIEDPDYPGNQEKELEMER